jgi:hypothetical protein
MAKEDRQIAEAVDKVLDKMIKRVETWWVTETAKEARKAEQAEARAVAKAAKAAEKAAAKAQVRARPVAVAVGCWGRGLVVGGSGQHPGLGTRSWVGGQRVVRCCCK